MLTMN